ncbi:alanine racemase [Thermoanaerobacterium thermosaccharolyticum]|uniref:Alanine racemase n=2 Tax=Thermoanaerobacterium thermosaccharolyticum TaxID=1517 RepID=D9TST5_THETC|nr:alanine racemase [Thermoanaerobacterium thermosaccharolyticum]ADL68100.1 alanine racemase [Thermoanaerobacterium thermosaccharolyticum DSM 571]OXT09421.1 alanine racemase [Thermoanaerobacterium thermosaccharolyticum]
MLNLYRPTWAEVNLNNIIHNYKEIRKITDKKAGIMAVVKANAYGHGSYEISKELIKCGVDYLAVATIDEALELREHGISKPILVLGYTPSKFADVIVKYDITQTAFELGYVKEISKEAIKQGKDAKIHVKIDTGMGRIGYNDMNKAYEEIVAMTSLKGIYIEGIFSHFSSSDERDKEYTMRQFKIFNDLTDRLKRSGIDIPIRHIANSAAILDLPETHLDMVRPGIILYGSYPSEEVDKKISLKCTISLRSKIVYIKDVPEGEYISYNRTYKTSRKSRIATLPIGYADGLNRLLSNNHSVIIKGKYAPIVGKICMDQCMVDVTSIEGVKEGDVATIMGESDGKIVSADEIANKLKTISYEVYCGISRRVPRIYIFNGEITKVENYLKC